MAFQHMNNMEVPQVSMMMQVVMVPVQYAVAVPQNMVQQDAGNQQYLASQSFRPQQTDVKMNKKSTRKLQNKKLEKDAVSKCSLPDQLASSVATAGLAAKSKEQLMRLGLGALCNQPCLSDPSLQKKSLHNEDSASTITRTTSCGEDSASVTARSCSHIGENLSLGDEESIFGEPASSVPAFVEVPFAEKAPVQIEEPRIGIDIGDVLIYTGKTQLFEVCGSVVAVQRIVERFGASNVFLVSRVRLGGYMHRKTQEWLHGPSGFLEKVGIPLDNVVFVEDISGPRGKGVAAARLGLSFFVDNKFEVLESVFADKEGNCAHLIQQCNGTLFHFANRGSGRWKPKPPAGMSGDFKSFYHAVSGWSDVLSFLGMASLETRRRGGKDVGPESQGRQNAHCAVARDLHENAHAKGSGLLVRRVDVKIEDDADFRVVERLIGVDNENFKFITGETGAKLILNGRGSPHPQPQSFEQEPLTVCIRAKTSESFEKAVALVEDLLRDVSTDYQEFQQAQSAS
mmetsp:Transcript_94356/g.177598  ORF Transcript_94356/g.177598 Transcript_94356/m.177598 type:complete len:513 (-) Transcript_94356:291-1829(-)